MESALKNFGTIFDIKRYAIHDGPGIRTTIFFKGCPLMCTWCHNPESQIITPEKVLKPSYRIVSPANNEETIGYTVSVSEMIKEINKDRLFHEESGGGVTFSGGEPLLQIDFLEALSDYCWSQDIDTTLDTCGYAEWTDIRRVKDKITRIYYDLKLIDDLEHIKHTGVSNKLILENLMMLDDEKIQVVIRFPVIPTITDTTKNIDLILNFMTHLKHTKAVHLLPYHKTGLSKYKRLRRDNILKNLEPPSDHQIEVLAQKFQDVGFSVKIGG